MDRYEMLKTINGDLLGECTELRKRIDFYRKYFSSQNNVEKVDTSDGCVYCTGDVADRPYVNDSSIYLDDENYLVNVNTGDRFEINYCPMCGKRLN